MIFPYRIFLRVGSLHMSSDKHLYINFKYLSYLNLWEEKIQDAPVSTTN